MAKEVRPDLVFCPYLYSVSFFLLFHFRSLRRSRAHQCLQYSYTVARIEADHAWQGLKVLELLNGLQNVGIGDEESQVNHKRLTNGWYNLP